MLILMGCTITAGALAVVTIHSSPTYRNTFVHRFGLTLSVLIRGIKEAEGYPAFQARGF